MTPLKFKSKKKLEDAIEKYFEWCDETETPPTMSRLAFNLGISRQTLINYSKKEEYFDTIKKAKDRVEASLEERMLKGTVTVPGAIFALKNNYGWTDKIETENVNMNQNVSYDLSALTTEQIRELLDNEN